MITVSYREKVSLLLCVKEWKITNQYAEKLESAVVNESKVWCDVLLRTDAVKDMI